VALRFGSFSALSGTDLQYTWRCLATRTTNPPDTNSWAMWRSELKTFHSISSYSQRQAR